MGIPIASTIPNIPKNNPIAEACGTDATYYMSCGDWGRLGAMPSASGAIARLVNSSIPASLHNSHRLV
ncbi:hypothetical protein [Nodularia sp. UHCC 0506]|uniref:hypothetical protein n=1 Tax=Nodularia sp. UHCC 0506 TaxID=3110243 RepID=UPI002B1F95F6|nr:hypothetical protein [Nodularia sp. UHCC 0506]MEA5517297.1 hypothetical protein [Nodularia sp. UHCC 0506]